MAILFRRTGEQAKPLDFLCPRVRLSIVLVEVVGIEPTSENFPYRRPTSLERILSYLRSVYAQTIQRRSLL